MKKTKTNSILIVLMKSLNIYSMGFQCVYVSNEHFIKLYHILNYINVQTHNMLGASEEAPGTNHIHF